MFPIKDDNPTEIKPLVTLSIIAICCFIFFYQFSISQIDNMELILKYGMRPNNLFSSNGLASIYAIFSSMFLHGGFLHLVGNMLFLWIYGNNIEDSMGHIKFLIFYVICGVSAALLQASINPSSDIPMIGASGAVSGVLSAYLLLFPKARVSTLVFIFFFITIIRIPAGLLIILWFASQVVNANITDPNSPGVAWFAHIGGFIMGALIIPFLKKEKFKFFSAGRNIKIKSSSIRIRFRK